MELPHHCHKPGWTTKLCHNFPKLITTECLSEVDKCHVEIHIMFFVFFLGVTYVYCFCVLPETTLTSPIKMFIQEIQRISSQQLTIVYTVIYTIGIKLSIFWLCCLLFTPYFLFRRNRLLRFRICWHYTIQKAGNPNSSVYWWRHSSLRNTRTKKLQNTKILIFSKIQTFLAELADNCTC